MRLLLEQYLESLDADKRNETITLIDKCTKLCYLSECKCAMYCNTEHCAYIYLFSVFRAPNLDISKRRIQRTS